MSSSTATISSTNSTITNNDRKRPISSSIRPSPSPPTAKRHGLSASNSRHSTHKNLRRSGRNEILLNKSNEQNERQSRPKQQFRHIDNKRSSSDSSRSSSNSNHSINQEYASPTMRTFNDTFQSTIDVNGMFNLFYKNNS
ncbi:unnamed protein product [Rotaria sp. Silwood2]|nr:unnamed protein product [Rotaria sp. Silwood2]CAF2473858.1 unnamed protein product [Rotaria sp. Silwood2]CAF2709468.1 unnamed protein product [Rotaria sp. Silwood2]CAF2860522.1 unnamed protein product [Rotaria sp. Silwood2]